MAAESHEEMVRRLITQRQSCAQIRPNAYDYVQYEPQTYDQHTFEPKRKTDEEIAINVLTEENAKLKEQYTDLVRKTTILLEAYKKLEAENELFKQKKAKRDSWENALTNVGKSFQGGYDKFIEWLKT